MDPKDIITENLLHITSIYPSPASSHVTVLCKAQQSGMAELYPSDILGHVILKNEIVMKEGDNNINILTDTLPVGLYLVSITSRNGQGTSMRFVIQ